jgi:hypothetical protein
LEHLGVPAGAVQDGLLLFILACASSASPAAFNAGFIALPSEVLSAAACAGLCRGPRAPPRPRAPGEV